MPKDLNIPINHLYRVKISPCSLGINDPSPFLIQYGQLHIFRHVKRRAVILHSKRIHHDRFSVKLRRQLWIDWKGIQYVAPDSLLVPALAFLVAFNYFLLVELLDSLLAQVFVDEAQRVAEFVQGDGLDFSPVGLGVVLLDVEIHSRLVCIDAFTVSADIGPVTRFCIVSDRFFLGVEGNMHLCCFNGLDEGEGDAGARRPFLDVGLNQVVELLGAIHESDSKVFMVGPSPNPRGFTLHVLYLQSQRGMVRVELTQTRLTFRKSNHYVGIMLYQKMRLKNKFQALQVFIGFPVLLNTNLHSAVP